MKQKLALIAIATLLTACGGGGSSTAPSPVATTPPVSTPPVVTPPVSDLQTSVPAPTYAAGSSELAFFTAFNDFRSKLGLGLLTQNVQLDAANRNHLKYLMTNSDINFSAIDPKSGRPVFHIEDPARPDFTGITELDRANFAQYGGTYVGESGAYGKGQGAITAFNDLVATVYHRAGLMFQFPREFGIAVGTDRFQTIVMTFGYRSTGQRNATDYFGSYPADKQTNVPRVAYIEVPNPFPELSFDEFKTRTSFPITVMAEASTSLSVNSFTVTEAGQDTPLDARLMTNESDPNKRVSRYSAHLVGKAPFKPNTTYNVHFDGAANGKRIVKNWSFTTGA